MTYQEYMRLLMAGQIVPQTSTDPFGPSIAPWEASGGSLLPPNVDKKGNELPWGLDSQAKAYNITQDWADINSDPAVLGGMYGEMPAPNQYTYEALPGQSLLYNASQMSGTLEQIIADEILNGGSASSAMSAIRRLSDPNSDTYDEEIASLVPTYTNELNEEVPDNDYIKDLALDFQKQFLTDPSANSVDPTTGLPSVSTPIKNSLADWYTQTNTPLPNEQYSPDMLATPQQLQLRDTIDGRQDKAKQRMAMIQEALKFARQDPMVMAPGAAAGTHGLRAAPEATYNPTQVGTGFSGGAANPNNLPMDERGNIGPLASPDMSFPNGINPNNMSLEDAESYIQSTMTDPQQTQRQAPGGGAVARPSGRSSGQSSALGARSGGMQFNFAGPNGAPNRQQEAIRKLNVRDLDARGDVERARQDQLQVRYDEKQRRAMIQLLAAQGHTPMNDTMARRRAMAQYGGFGV